MKKTTIGPLGLLLLLSPGIFSCWILGDMLYEDLEAKRALHQYDKAMPRTVDAEINSLHWDEYPHDPPDEGMILPGLIQ